MLLVAVLGLDVADAFQSFAAGESHTFSYLSTRERDSGAMLADLDGASRAAADALLLDADAGPAGAMLEGLDRYRLVRPAVRVVLLAAERQPGDPLVAQLVALGVGDVITCPPEDMPNALTAVLIRDPASYAELRRWRTLQAAAPSAADGKGSHPAPGSEPIRVFAQDQRRPVTVVVAGAARGVGTTELAWILAHALARQGLKVALLADLSSRVAQVIQTERVAPGLSLRVLPYDREPPPLTPQQEKANWRPPDRVRTLLDLAGKADVAIVDIGDLSSALEREAQMLAVSDRVLVCWPQAEVRLQAILSELAARKAAWTSYVGQATHVGYLTPVQLTAVNGGALVQGIQAAIGTTDDITVVPVPAGPKGPDMALLLEHLAPRPGKGALRRAELLAALRGGGTAQVTATSQQMRGPAMLAGYALGLCFRVVPFAAVLWLAGGVAATFDLPIPDWWPGASRVATFMRSAWSVVSGGLG